MANGDGNSYTGVEFDGSAVVQATFGCPPNLSNCSFTNVVFKNAHMLNANVARAHFLAVQFINCDLKGVDFSRAASFVNVTIS